LQDEMPACELTPRFHSIQGKVLFSSLARGYRGVRQLVPSFYFIIKAL
jgi:hypothetical protein